jgi:hypothetical protein
MGSFQSCSTVGTKFLIPTSENKNKSAMRNNYIPTQTFNLSSGSFQRSMEIYPLLLSAFLLDNNACAASYDIKDSFRGHTGVKDSATRGYVWDFFLRGLGFGREARLKQVRSGDDSADSSGRSIAPEDIVVRSKKNS